MIYEKMKYLQRLFIIILFCLTDILIISTNDDSAIIFGIVYNVLVLFHISIEPYVLTYQEIIENYNEFHKEED